jgi:N-acyl homoserine lactone hydrolase
MKSTRAPFALALVSVLASLTGGAGCAATSHPTAPATLGVARASSALETVVDLPGPITVETVVAADWEVPRSGLINLDHPRAKAAHLVDGPEPIEIVFHALHHPAQGLFLVDTGVEHAFVTDPDHALIHGVFGTLAHLDKLKVRVDTGSWLARQKEPVSGVLLTHLHLDHVMGMRDIPPGSPIYVGAGDAEEHALMNLLEASLYDRSLEGRGPLREVRFSPDPEGEFEGVLDVLGDGSLWALQVPGHTPGSIAYVARTPDGPVLFTGDACHSAWGWRNEVEPGTFSSNEAKSAVSLARLERFAAKHPRMRVLLGHQELTSGSRPPGG